MKHIGVVSYNIYGNFTNYGSALQSWALCKTINQIGNGVFDAVLVDYCPKVHLDKNIIDPIKNMWDQDSESILACKQSLPAIIENYEKFQSFFNNRFKITHEKYNYKNFDEICKKDCIDAFVCGSDTIFCTIEFNGFDDGYFANYSPMRKKSISYAASFGDAEFNNDSYAILKERLNNFLSLGIRESKYVQYINDHINVPCQQTIDPTLLLNSEDYDVIASKELIKKKYLLLYARRYDKKMFDFADKIAKDMGLCVVDISLRAEGLKSFHEPWYKAGVEDFLSIVKYSNYVITNSFHGLIFAIQYRKPFIVFSREQADDKISELLDLLGLQGRLFKESSSICYDAIDYDKVHTIIKNERNKSLNFLIQSLKLLIK